MPTAQTISFKNFHFTIVPLRLRTFAYTGTVSFRFFSPLFFSTHNHTNVEPPHGSHTYNARQSEALQSNIVLTSAGRALSPASGAPRLVRAFCGCAAFLFGSATLRLLLRYLGSYHRQSHAALPPPFGFG
jgi:hypothetical protein